MAQTQKGLKSGDALDSMTHTFVDVGNTSIKVVGYNQKRRYLLIINDSDQVIYLYHGGPAEIHKGVRVEANGGKYECSHVLSNLCEHPLFAIQEKSQVKRLLVSEGL